jgi:hypothetical protein
MVEDVLFVLGSLGHEGTTSQHERFLKEFWQEEFDVLETAKLTNLDRDRLPRKKIRTFNSKLQGVNIDSGARKNVQEVLGKTFSGYVHGSAAHTMEIYGGENPRFNVFEMKFTPPWNTQAEDLKHYFHRAVCIFGIVAGAFSDQLLLGKLLILRTQLEKAWAMKFDDLAFPPQHRKIFNGFLYGFLMPEEYLNASKRRTPTTTFAPASRTIRPHARGCRTAPNCAAKSDSPCSSTK